jgi:hypothetical protein
LIVAVTETAASRWTYTWTVTSIRLVPCGASAASVCRCRQQAFLFDLFVIAVHPAQLPFGGQVRRKIVEGSSEFEGVGEAQAKSSSN